MSSCHVFVSKIGNILTSKVGWSPIIFLHFPVNILSSYFRCFLCKNKNYIFVFWFNERENKIHVFYMMRRRDSLFNVIFGWLKIYINIHRHAYSFSLLVKHERTKSINEHSETNTSIILPRIIRPAGSKLWDRVPGANCHYPSTRRSFNNIQVCLYMEI